jgi:hypothetical protein
MMNSTDHIGASRIRHDPVGRYRPGRRKSRHPPEVPRSSVMALAFRTPPPAPVAGLDEQQRVSGWRGSIHNARRRIAKRLKESPSLRGRRAEALTQEYPDARLNASNETGLPESSLPRACPYTVDQVLSEDFWPEPDTLCL